MGHLAVWAFDHGQRFFLTEDIGAAERRGERLAMIWYAVDRKHRRRTHSNLELAFPEWTPEERRRVAKETYRHYGRVLGDFLRAPIRTDEEVLASFDMEGLEHLERVEAMGRGVLVITGHVGNFERFGQVCRALGRKISVVARDANQDGVQARVAELRAATGIEVLSRGEAALPIVRKLRRRELVALMPDQNDTECFVPFFGKLCGTVLGPGVLHERTGAPILPAFCIRTGVGRYHVRVCPPIDPENEEKDPVAIMAAINAVLESVIRDHPEQWLWMHDRWRTARRRGLLE